MLLPVVYMSVCNGEMFSCVNFDTKSFILLLEMYVCMYV